MLLRRRMMGMGGEKPFEEQYLTFEALEDCVFTMDCTSPNFTTSISYSTDGGSTWTTETINVAKTITTPTITQGNKVLWKGIASSLGATSPTTSIFSSSGAYMAYGNTMSLLYGDNFKDKFSFDRVGVFFRLFKNETNLMDVENLILPSTSVTSSGYAEMFYGCTGIEKAPKLPATSLSTYCYQSMFYGCTSLVEAPELPAEKLLIASYDYMFYNCTSLNYVKCLATDISATNSHRNWLRNVSATGKFVKAASMNDWPSGYNGIPSGWTVIDA